MRTQSLPKDSNLKPSDVVKRVLSWLNKQEKWLLVIDNLDDVTVIDGYLQILSESPDRHTLITTRNQHAENIPAEGFEVGVYDVNDATELLLTRSQMKGIGETQEGWTEGGPATRRYRPGQSIVYGFQIINAKIKGSQKEPQIVYFVRVFRDKTQPQQITNL